MTKYLLLRHYRGAAVSVNTVPMDQWTPEELSAHVQYMQDFAARLEGSSEFVQSQALSPEGEKAGAETCSDLDFLVAGGGFEPPTFGL